MYWWSGRFVNHWFCHYRENSLNLFGETESHMLQHSFKISELSNLSVLRWGGVNFSLYILQIQFLSTLFSFSFSFSLLNQDRLQLSTKPRPSDDTSRNFLFYLATTLATSKAHRLAQDCWSIDNSSTKLFKLLNSATYSSILNAHQNGFCDMYALGHLLWPNNILQVWENTWRKRRR